MLVDQAIEILKEFKLKGKGDYPIQIMSISGGITYAEDIQIIEAMSYDGERVWIYSTDLHFPEWVKTA